MHYMEEMETKDAQFIPHNQHCEKPALSMWCDQPRKLGVITGIKE